MTLANNINNNNIGRGGLTFLNIRTFLKIRPKGPLFWYVFGKPLFQKTISYKTIRGTLLTCLKNDFFTNVLKKLVVELKKNKKVDKNFQKNCSPLDVLASRAMKHSPTENYHRGHSSLQPQLVTSGFVDLPYLLMMTSAPEQRHNSIHIKWCPTSSPRVNPKMSWYNKLRNILF